MTSAFPIRTIKRTFKQYYQGEISQDVCVIVNDYLYEILHQIIEQCIIEFQEINQQRINQGLPTHKRLDKSSIIHVKSKYSQQIQITGKIGQSNKELFCRKKEANEVIKNGT